MYKFLTDDITSRFIKSLLYNSWLPNYRTVSEGDNLVAGTIYTFRSNFIKCYKSGVLGDTAEYKVIGVCDLENSDMKGYTNYLAPGAGYDSKTHVRLGYYLRALRDMRGIDLMPLYNCYCNNYLNSCYLTATGIIKAKNEAYKEIAVPILFNQTYTIALDNPYVTIIAPAFIKNNQEVTVDGISISESLVAEYLTSYNTLQFNRPITFRVDNDNAYRQKFERYLTLIIQIPAECETSIVVLEGDYTNRRSKKVISMEHPRYDLSHLPEDAKHFEDMNEKEMNYLFTSDFSLLKMNDKTSYAFSDGLILYLIRHVITVDEEISGNIKRVQDNSGAAGYKWNAEGIWNDYLRKYIFDTYQKANKSSCTGVNRQRWVNGRHSNFDKLGWVDTDVESFFDRKVGK